MSWQASGRASVGCLTISITSRHLRRPLPFHTPTGSGGTGRDREDGEGSARFLVGSKARVESKGKAQVWESSRSGSGGYNTSVRGTATRQRAELQPQETISDQSSTSSWSPPECAQYKLRQTPARFKRLQMAGGCTDWDDNLTKVFLDLCIAEKEKLNFNFKKGLTKIGWQNLYRNFRQQTGRQ